MERSWPGGLGAPPAGRLQSARCALLPSGGYTRHCSSRRRTQDFRNDPSSSVLVLIVITAVAAAIGVPGQCEVSYSARSKRHMHTNRQLRMDASDTELLILLPSPTQRPLVPSPGGTLPRESLLSSLSPPCPSESHHVSHLIHSESQSP